MQVPTIFRSAANGCHVGFVSQAAASEGRPSSVLYSTGGLPVLQFIILHLSSFITFFTMYLTNVNVVQIFYKDT